MRTNRVLVSSLDRRFSALAPRVTKTLITVLSFLSQRGVAVDVFLINSRQMRALYRSAGHDVITDVLSFPHASHFPTPDHSFAYLGEIYLNTQRTAEYARAPRWPRDVLLVHGILHCLGYDHKKKNDIIAMERLETQLLHRLGVSRSMR